MKIFLKPLLILLGMMTSNSGMYAQLLTTERINYSLFRPAGWYIYYTANLAV